jgi:hypothetical protein
MSKRWPELLRGRRLLAAGAVLAAVLLVGLLALVLRPVGPSPLTAQIDAVALTSVQFDGYGVSVPAGAREVWSTVHPGLQDGVLQLAFTAPPAEVDEVLSSMGLSAQALRADAVPFSDNEFSDSAWPVTTTPRGSGVRGATGAWVSHPDRVAYLVAVVPAHPNDLRLYVVALQM